MYQNLRRTEYFSFKNCHIAIPASNLSDYKAVRGYGNSLFLGIICHIRAFLRHFLRKTQKVLSKKAFFRFNAWEFQSLLITSPSMRKKLRPDVASDTSRRNNNCVTTQHQIRRDENEGTNSHYNNIWQFPVLFRELPYVLLH